MDGQGRTPAHGRPQDRRRPTVVVSGLCSDAHTWNLVYLELLLDELGCDVVNLGACVPVELLLTACRRHRPDLVVLSSVNGHGHQDGLTAITGLRADPELAATPAVIGGKLGIAGRDLARDAELAYAGFDAVFADDLESSRALRSMVGRLGRASRAPEVA